VLTIDEARCELVLQEAIGPCFLARSLRMLLEIAQNQRSNTSVEGRLSVVFGWLMVGGMRVVRG
jgi:hypothetical protein